MAVEIVEPRDDYASLGPSMRARLDEAERVESKLHNYLLLLAERGPMSNLIAREICMVVGLDTLKANIDNTTWPWEASYDRARRRT